MAFHLSGFSLYVVFIIFFTNLMIGSGSGVVKMFMLRLAEHEILNAHKYKNIKKFSIFQAEVSAECYFSCS